MTGENYSPLLKQITHIKTQYYISVIYSMSKKWIFLKLISFPYLTRNLKKMYGRDKMILICTGEDSIYSSASTGSNVKMTSNSIYDIILFSSA